MALGSERMSGRDGMAIRMVTNLVGKNHTNRLTWDYFPRILNTWEKIPRNKVQINTSPRSLSCETHTPAPSQPSLLPLLSHSDPAQHWPRTADPDPDQAGGRAAAMAAARHPRAALLHPVVTTAAEAEDVAATMAPAAAPPAAIRAPMTAQATHAAVGAPTTRPATPAEAVAPTMRRAMPAGVVARTTARTTVEGGRWRLQPSASSALSTSGRREINTWSMRRPSSTSTSKRQPAHSTLSAWASRSPATVCMRPATVL